MAGRTDKIDRVVAMLKEKNRNKQQLPTEKIIHLDKLVDLVQSQISVSTKILQSAR
jgi:hypothetical protein